MAERIIHNMKSMLDGSRFEHRGEIVVIGLGRFGLALGRELSRLGHSVLAIDRNADLIELHKDDFTSVATGDTTNERTLKFLGVDQAKTVVVCIGNNIEASLLTAALLVEMGIPNVWAKAITAEHGKILSTLNVHHVTFPEAEMGERVAHLVTGKLEEFVRLNTEVEAGKLREEDEFVISQMTVPERFAGQILGSAGIRAGYRVTVVCIKPEGGKFTYAEAETVLGQNDHIVVAGHPDDVERFAGVKHS
ncbi:MAG: potassium channel family protein [Ilumatobacteraceae bacterium]